MDKIKQIINTGSCDLYDKIKNVNKPIVDLMNIHGVGITKAKQFDFLGYTSIEQLRNSKNISELLNNTQLKGIKYYDDLLKRIPRNEIEKHEKLLKRILSKIDPMAELTIAGSYRRNKRDSGDIDVLLKSNDKKIYNTFINKLKSMSYLVEDLAFGNKKYNGISKLGKNGICRRIDIMYTTPKEYPFAILYFTGSGDFNTKMREHALSLGYSMNEYSLKNSDGSYNDKLNEQQFISENDIFNFLKLKYVNPEDRL